MYCGSEERLFYGSLGTCRISERRHIQQRYGWILRNGHCPFLLYFSLVRQYQQCRKTDTHCSFIINSGLPWVSATSGVQGRGVVWDRRGFLMQLLIVLLTFLPLCLLLVWAEESVCVGPLPFREIESLSGERSVYVQVFYSSLRICCSRCCASFFLCSYVLIV